MLCSNCSQPVRPVVAVDIDGTLGNYHLHFEQFAQGWLGMPGYSVEPVYDGSLPYRDWFGNEFGVDITTFRTIKLAYRQGGMKRTMPAFEHAQGMMASLRRHAEVWLTTTRPAYRYDRVDPDTVAWLEYNSIKYDGLLFDEHKIYELYRRVDAGRVVAVLDDEPAVLDEVVQGLPLLLRTAYNRGAEWYGMSVDSLPAALQAMTRLLTEWNEEHG